MATKKKSTAPVETNNVAGDVSWDDVDGARTGGNFLKIESGETIVIHVVGGKPSGKRDLVWIKDGKNETSAEYDPEDPSHVGLEKKTQFEFTVVDVTDGRRAETLLTWDVAAIWAKALSKLHHKYDLAKTLVEISRNGEGKKTKYTFLPDAAVTPEILDDVDALMANRSE